MIILTLPLEDINRERISGVDKSDLFALTETSSHTHADYVHVQLHVGRAFNLACASAIRAFR